MSSIYHVTDQFAKLDTPRAIDNGTCHFCERRIGDEPAVFLTNPFIPSKNKLVAHRRCVPPAAFHDDASGEEQE
jgi:hypothetical protein